MDQSTLDSSSPLFLQHTPDIICFTKNKIILIFTHSLITHFLQSFSFFHSVQLLPKTLLGWTVQISSIRIAPSPTINIFNIRLNIVCVSHSVMSSPLQSHGLRLTRLLYPCNSPDKNTGVCCDSFLQGIIPTQGSNLGLPHGGQSLYHLSHQGSPQYCSIIVIISSWLTQVMVIRLSGYFKKDFNKTLRRSSKKSNAPLTI